ncbi:secreted RxLR effector protein 161-like [Primulina tabacum]|uniref:secreted RxLR effector protein 161-like n=1 Tax=Primulina tabacum TaxID=48773 RepID=UPI003F5A0277
MGSLMYAMVCTRPDLDHASSIVSRFMSKPGKMHWETVKWVMRYLKGSVNQFLVYGEGQTTTGNELMGYVDADYAGDLDKRRSFSGYTFILYGNLSILLSLKLQRYG